VANEEANTLRKRKNGTNWKVWINGLTINVELCGRIL
jgi:hypothetical protein